MIYVEAPAPAIDSKKGLFLAGGITGCPDWQSDLVSKLEDLDLAVYNPRRENFPIKDPSASLQQIQWEHDMLRHADIISFWFCKETMCPIVLYELGAWSMTSKPILIGIDPGYSRRQDVEIQTNLVRPDVSIVYDIDSLKDQIFILTNEIQMV